MKIQEAVPVLDVLIVDDSAAIRKILQRVLRQAEVPLGQVFEAGDGAEAIEVLKKQPVGLVPSDINMPNMDGREFLTKVRAEPGWEKLPIVMVSTEGTQAKVMDAVGRDRKSTRLNSSHIPLSRMPS